MNAQRANAANHQRAKKAEDGTMNKPPVDKDSTKAVVADKLREIYHTSDEPKRARECLLKMSDSNDRMYLPLVLRQGWEAWKQQAKDQAINNGIVAALVLSVVMGLAISRLGILGIDDDLLAETRENYMEYYMLFNTASSFFAILAVVNSFMSVYVYDVWAIDFEDFVYLHKRFLLDGWLTQCPNFVGILLCQLGLAFGSASILPSPWAQSSHIFGMVMTALTWATFLLLLVLGSSHAKNSYDRSHKKGYDELIQEIFAEVTDGQDLSDSDASSGSGDPRDITQGEGDELITTRAGTRNTSKPHGGQNFRSALIRSS